MNVQYGVRAPWIGGDTSALNWRRSFHGRVDEIGGARDFVGFLLANTRFAEQAEFAVSEFAGNALRHTISGQRGGWFCVHVGMGANGMAISDHGGPRATVCVAVRDLGGSGIPAIEVREDHESRGGLAAIAEFAVTLGCDGSPQRGHLVWAELGLPEAA
ncbi:ATP-binding protein [Spongiactinospora rosea]|uniref:ATP-binding protein n=2 Tax=Spongiactinospora rosea TaxID=2248750 RepID=A0A366M4U2_9ACTN|nr:ATP-binding protein [Spongiactinospora rosea]